MTSWIAAGAIAVAGLFAAVVAKSQPGKTVTVQPASVSQAPSASPGSTGSSSSNGGTSSNNPDNSGLQAPSQAPAPSRGSGHVVSGGS